MGNKLISIARNVVQDFDRLHHYGTDELGDVGMRNAFDDIILQLIRLPLSPHQNG